MPAQKLTKKSEEQIGSVLSQAADYVQEGDTPTEALYKAASAAQLSAGHVRLAVQAYNTGRSLGQIRNGDSLAEKSAEFPLASAVDILDRMFPSLPKSASDAHQETVVSADYAVGPHWLERERQHAKTAVALDPLSDKPFESLPTFPGREAKRALEANHQLSRKVAHAKLRTFQLGYDSMALLEKVAAYFRQPSALPFDSVRANAVAARGAKAGVLMDKAASLKRPPKRPPDEEHLVDWTQEPYSLIKAGMDLAQAFVDTRNEHAELSKQASAERAENLRPFAQGSAQPTHTGSVWCDKEEPTQEKQAIGMGGIGLGAAIGGTAKGLTSRLAPKSKEELVAGVMQQMDTPAHQQRMNQIRVQGWFHDWKLNHPGLGGYDLSQMSEAYNQLNGVAPRVMQHQAAAQALMQKYLEQASNIDTFDLDQLMGMEDKLQKRELTATKMHDPNTSSMAGGAQA